MKSILFFILPLFINSCTEENMKSQEIKTNASYTISKNGKRQINNNNFDFVKFWAELGDAVKKNDTNKIKQFIIIPLEILGREDIDPHFYLNKNEVINAFLYAINKGGYYDPEKDISISNKQLLLTKLDSINEYKPSSDKQWINDFVFVKTANGWKLKTLYLDTKIYKRKNLS